MFERFLDRFHPTESTRVLDVGVTSDVRRPESNYFEKMYPFPERITCIGTEDGSHLMDQYPGLQYKRVEPGQRLPFQDNEFDVAFSNAVLEHVGAREDQAAFVRETIRVSRAFFITTPNRWFPIEHHTGLPFLHFLPPHLFRRTIQRTKYKYWAEEANLNILTIKELRRLFPPHVEVDIEIIRFFGFASNLIAAGTTAPGRR